MRELKELEKRVAELTGEHDEVQKAVDELTDEYAALSQQCVTLRREAAVLSGDVSQMQQLRAVLRGSSEETAALQKRRDTAIKEIERLERELAEVHARRDEVQPLAEKLASLDAQLASVGPRLSRTQKSLREALRAKRDAEHITKALRDEEASLHSNIDHLRSTSDKLQAAIDRMTADGKRGGRFAGDAAETMVETLNARIKAVEQELEEARASHAEELRANEHELDSLRARLRAAAESAAKREAELESLEIEKTALSTRVDTLAARHDARSAASSSGGPAAADVTGGAGDDADVKSPTKRQLSTMFRSKKSKGLKAKAKLVGRIAVLAPPSEELKFRSRARKGGSDGLEWLRPYNEAWHDNMDSRSLMTGNVPMSHLTPGGPLRTPYDVTSESMSSTIENAFKTIERSARKGASSEGTAPHDRTYKSAAELFPAVPDVESSEDEHDLAALYGGKKRRSGGDLRRLSAVTEHSSGRARI